MTMFLDSFKVRLVFYFLFSVLFYLFLVTTTKANVKNRYTMEPIWDNSESLTSVPKLNYNSDNAVFISPKERHCLILTLLGEATANNRAEVIAITRLILRRQASADRYGVCLCQVTLAHKQFSVWNNRSMHTFRYDPVRYETYSKWANEALLKGPMQHNHYWHPKTMKKLYKRHNPYWAKSCIVRETIGHATFCTIDVGAFRNARDSAKPTRYNKRLSKSDRRRHSRFQRTVRSFRKY